MTEVDAFLTNCRLADGRLVDIGIAGGKIAAVGEGAAASSNSAPELDIARDLVLPGLVDGHMHQWVIQDFERTRVDEISDLPRQVVARRCYHRLLRGSAHKS